MFLITPPILNNLYSVWFFGRVMLSLVAGQKFKFHLDIQLDASLCPNEHTKRFCGSLSIHSPLYTTERSQPLCFSNSVNTLLVRIFDL